MSKYLLLFTIGPVKSFIQESRKAQDLFASSALLSNLCKDAIIKANDVFKKNKFELITPNFDMNSKDEFPSIPNRFLASITGKDLETFSTNTEKIKKELIEEFSIIKFGNDEIKLPTGAKEQLDEHLDIRWIIIPYTKETFSKDFAKINKLLAGIKNYRPLHNTSELGRKCIVDGKRNVKFYRKIRDNEIKLNKKTNLYSKLYQPEDAVTILEPNNDDTELKIWHLQKGEGISAVTLKKRLFQNEPHQFPSTVSISLLHVFEHLKDDENFISFEEKVNGENKIFGHSNDQLFYFDNIKPLFEKENKTNEIVTFQKEHRKWSEKLDLPMTTYYALIRFDGDNMGDWFSGVYKNDTLSFKEYQKKLSGFIIEFADKMKTEITEPLGRVIYAGGEDFMAMINLHNLHKSIELIRANFKNLISDKMQEFISVKKEFSLSMGISIAHYKEPLQLVLDKTAQMEKLAKNSGRNRFAIRVSKHSGGQLQTVLPWKDNNLDNIYKIVAAIAKKEISSAFLLKTYNYCDELNFDTEAKEIIKSKKKLYIDRAIEQGDKTKVFEPINNSLDSFLEHSSIKDFAELLLIIDFIQRHEYTRNKQ